MITFIAAFIWLIQCEKFEFKDKLFYFISLNLKINHSNLLVE